MTGAHSLPSRSYNIESVLCKSSASRPWTIISDCGSMERVIYVKNLCCSRRELLKYKITSQLPSVGELHHFYAAPAPSKNFDAALSGAPTLLNSRPTFFKSKEVKIMDRIFL
jgi:hypothetical protein